MNATTIEYVCPPADILDDWYRAACSCGWSGPERAVEESQGEEYDAWRLACGDADDHEFCGC